MKIIKDLLTIHRIYGNMLQISTVKALVVHYVGNPGTSATGNVAWFKSNSRNNDNPVFASAHYFVGLEGEIIQTIEENRGAYHAGGKTYTQIAKDLFYDSVRKTIYPHDKCIGIETCHPDSTGKFNPKTEASLIELCRDIVKRHGLNKDQLIRHYDVTGKICPKYYVDNPSSWESFKKRVFEDK